jgi:hypothetical protein
MIDKDVKVIFVGQRQWVEKTRFDALENAATELHDAKARILALESAIVPVGLWLRSALKCKAFVWDSDQREAALECLFAAQMAMDGIVSESGTFTKETSGQDGS